MDAEASLEQTAQDVVGKRWQAPHYVVVKLAQPARNEHQQGLAKLNRCGDAHGYTSEQRGASKFERALTNRTAEGSRGDTSSS